MVRVKRLESLVNPGGKKNIFQYRQLGKVRTKSTKPEPSYFAGTNDTQLQNGTTWVTFCNFHYYVFETAQDGKIICVGVSRD